MTMTTEDILKSLSDLRKNLTAAQGQITDITKAIAALPATPREEAKCKTCGTQFRGPRSLAEHVYNSHGGPVPEHYLAAEKHDPLIVIRNEPEPGRYWKIPDEAKS